MNSKSRILAEMIEDSKGKFITVEYIKADGSTRILNGRLGVVKARSTSTKKSKPNTDTQHITLYDMVKKAYRSVNRDTITRIRANGFEIKIV